MKNLLVILLLLIPITGMTEETNYEQELTQALEESTTLLENYKTTNQNLRDLVTGQTNLIDRQNNYIQNQNHLINDLIPELNETKNYWTEYESLTEQQIKSLERSLFVTELQVYSFGGALGGALLGSAFGGDYTIEGAAVGALTGAGVYLFFHFID